MITTDDRFTAINSSDGANAQRLEARASRRVDLALAVLFVIALGVVVWLIVSSNVLDVSAAARNAAAQPAPQAPQVPYFPSLHVNQATEIEPPPPTF